MGIDSEQPIKLLVWSGIVHEYLIRRARRDLGSINKIHEELDEVLSVVAIYAHMLVWHWEIYTRVSRRRLIFPEAHTIAGVPENNKKQARDPEQKL